MSEDGRRDRNSTIHEISQKIRLSLSILVFVIATLFAVILRYLYKPAESYLDFLPDFSVTLIIGIVFYLTIIGLYLSIRMSRQVLRIAEDYGNRLEKILGVTKDLREEVHGDLLLEKVLDTALVITKSEAGAILLSDGEKLVFKIVRGEKTESLAGSSIQKEKGIAGWVARTGQPIRVADVSTDDRFDGDVDSLAGFKTRTVMAIPLKTKDGVIGVLELLNRKGGHAFRERDEEIITYLAEQAAISIIKARLYDDQRNYEIHLTGLLIDAIDHHNEEKRGHAKRVARYSTLIARGLHMSEEEQKRLYFASILHDVGFLKIQADDVFKKEEYLRHPVIGYEMIQPINFYADMAPLILHHHEHYDGNGYPAQLKEKDIPVESRIIAVAEAFDAMVSMNSYKVPVSYEAALDELRRRAGSQFDPEMVDIFIAEMKPQYVES